MKLYTLLDNEKNTYQGQEIQKHLTAVGWWPMKLNHSTGGGCQISATLSRDILNHTPTSCITTQWTWHNVPERDRNRR